ncbi:MAG: uncharacterized protein KVP18_001236 [Porospora cf. gigantea A]|uniref:uncharacterized protein n=1 Tax=Porospora cf. gigantea A TaxID=2853593 RepID=UPI00355A1011|nr:MAG: hypothetical protein KVP18_001236 [Porospora cf. gigantea A]
MQAVFDSTHDLPQRPQTLVKRTEEAKIATSVLPEAEHDVPNGAVDGESVPTSTVFETFGELDTELRSALSQRSRRPARQYEAGEPHLTETLASRISRLRGELQDLDTLVEANLLQHQGGDEGWNTKGASLFSERVGASPTEFRHEIQAVKADLETLERSEKTLRNQPRREGVSAASSLAEIDAVMAALNGTHEGRTSVDVVLTDVPALSGQVETDQLLKVESRLAAIENQLGVADNTAVANQLGMGDLHSALLEIASRLVIVDKSKLDTLSVRVKRLSDEADRLKGRISALRSGGDGRSTVDDMAQTAQLYELCYRWRHLSGLLPHMVRRLAVLSVVHNEASTAISRLNDIEAQQAQTNTILEDAESRFEQARNQVAADLSTARELVAKLI